MFSKLFGLLIICTLVSFGKNARDGRIYHGLPAMRGQFPWHAGLIVEKNGTNGLGSNYCGGAVIGRLWVLTAAHCVNGSDVFEVKVLLASVAKADENDSSRIKVVSKEWWIHEGFKKLDYYGFVGDIALVKLPKLMVFDENVQPIALASEEIPLNTSTILSGWGATGLGDKVGLINLKHTTLFIKTCPRAHFGYFCAFPDPKSEAQAACSADSGSPLVVKKNTPTHVGVTSTGIVGCPKGGYNKFASTAYYRQWIREKTGI